LCYDANGNQVRHSNGGPVAYNPGGLLLEKIVNFGGAAQTTLYLGDNVEIDFSGT
jgi:hypothetical protein